jgi:hypothetical protein
MMDKSNNHDYIEQCPNCHKYLTALQAKNHQCASSFEIKEIPILYGFEYTEENGHKTFIAHGIDGILYRLIQTKTSLADENLQRKRTDDNLTEPRIWFCPSSVKRSSM